MGAVLPSSFTPFEPLELEIGESSHNSYTLEAMVIACVFSGHAQMTPSSEQHQVLFPSNFGIFGAAPAREGGGAPSSATRQREEQHRHTECGSHTKGDKGGHTRQGGGAQQGGRGYQNGGNREPEWSKWWSVRMGGSDNKVDGLASQPRRYRMPGQPLLNRHQVGGVWGNVSASGARRASFVTRALPVDCCR